MGSLEILKQSLSQVLWAFGDDSVDLLRDLHERAGQRATGETLEQFATEQEEKGDTIIQTVSGADHIYFLQYGRGASSGGEGILKEIIYRWADVKGIFAGIEKEYQKRSIAYAITKKIHEEGTYLKRFGKTFSGFENPVNSAFDTARLEKLKKDLGEAFVLNIENYLITEFEKNKK